MYIFLLRYKTKYLWIDQNSYAKFIHGIVLCERENENFTLLFVVSINLYMPVKCLFFASCHNQQEEIQTSKHLIERFNKLGQLRLILSKFILIL